jgi:hypothetical protein
MKNYNVNSSGWFETNQEEILKAKKYGTFIPYDFKPNLIRLNQRFTFFDDNNEDHIIDYSIRSVPFKRHPYDNCVLLCVKLKDGRFLAKRHLNNQFITLAYGH